jgi:hypothetical protein
VTGCRLAHPAGSSCGGKQDEHLADANRRIVTRRPAKSLNTLISGQVHLDGRSPAPAFTNVPRPSRLRSTLGAVLSGGGCSGSRSRGSAGVVGESANYERGKEQQSGFNGCRVVETNPNRPVPPTLPLQGCQLVVTRGERVPLSPLTGRAQGQLPASPDQCATTSQGTRLERARSRARSVPCFDGTRPETRPSDLPNLSIRCRDGRPRSDAPEAQRPNPHQCKEATLPRYTCQLKIDHHRTRYTRTEPIPASSTPRNENQDPWRAPASSHPNVS